MDHDEQVRASLTLGLGWVAAFVLVLTLLAALALSR